MTRRCKRVCDNCLDEIVEHWGYWHVERVRGYQVTETYHDTSKPRIIWDFCGQLCMTKKVQEWEQLHGKTKHQDR